MRCALPAKKLLDALANYVTGTNKAPARPPRHGQESTDFAGQNVTRRQEQSRRFGVEGGAVARKRGSSQRLARSGNEESALCADASVAETRRAGNVPSVFVPNRS